MNINERTIGLIGKDNLKIFENKTIAIFGLGGVGGTAAEALLRSGFKNLIICDFDIVNESNLNRQVLYTSQDVGLLKVDVAKRRLLSINPEANIINLNCKANAKISEILCEFSIDFVVDAIDDVEGKKAIASYCSANKIPLIMSMGMANRICPTNVYITTLNKTENDPLAKKMRHDLKAENLDISLINVVASKEIPAKDGSKLNSMIMVPSSAGLNIAYFVATHFMKVFNKNN